MCPCLRMRVRMRVCVYLCLGNKYNNFAKYKNISHTKSFNPKLGKACTMVDRLLKNILLCLQIHQDTGLIIVFITQILILDGH